MKRYFWDTSALILLLQGEPRMLRYADSPGITSVLNLLELSVWIRHAGYDKDINIVKRGLEIIECIPSDAVDEMEELRRTLRQKTGKKVSYIDVVGYILAKRNNAVFLTSDGAFKGVENVEYISP